MITSCGDNIFPQFFKIDVIEANLSKLTDDPLVVEVTLIPLFPETSSNIISKETNPSLSCSFVKIIASYESPEILLTVTVSMLCEPFKNILTTGILIGSSALNDKVIVSPTLAKLFWFELLDDIFT